jgi:hypothetical protein
MSDSCDFSSWDSREREQRRHDTMNADEVRAAAERYRLFKMGQYQYAAHPKPRAAVLDDQKTLASAYLELAARPVVPVEVYRAALDCMADAACADPGCSASECVMARFILSLESKP